jgi:hypothetical protein
MITRGFKGIVLTTFLISGLSASALPGQIIGGTVRDSASAEPVSGAVVMLMDASREMVARTITSAAGEFRLRGERAAVLRITRIGYRPHEQPIEPTAGTALSIRVVALGASLRPVAVSTQPVCPARSDQQEALSIWASATDAMLAMTVASTDSSQSGSVLQLLYNRLLRNDGTVRGQTTRRVLTANASPIRADRAPKEFVDSGYVLRRGDVLTYYAPDPEILLDSTFAATHCLSIRTDARAHRGEVGVAFTPTSVRRFIPEIEGVLWLTRSPMALRSLTFEYRGVEQAIMDVNAGGRLDFETLSNGVPVIRSWSLRSPRLDFRPLFRTIDGRTIREGEIAAVAALYETGGMIIGGQLTDGTVLTVPLATLGGRVLNPRTGDPVYNARVTLDSTDQVAMTDYFGQFSFENVLPGPYTIRARDSVMIFSAKLDTTDQFVLDTTVRQIVRRNATMGVEARIGHVVPIEMRMPWRDKVYGCTVAGSSGPEMRFIVMGLVVNQRDEPIANAKVQLKWADPSRDSRLETEMETTSDAGGGFIVCGLPAEVDLSARVVSRIGTDHRGTMRVPRMNYDGQGRPRSSVIRTLRLVVSQSGSAGRP